MNTHSVAFCLVATIFVTASVYTMISCKTCSPFVEYEKSLNAEQLQVYHQVVKERQNIYLIGLVIGTLVAFIYLYTNGLGLNPLNNSCVFVAIALAIQYIVYTLYPKTNYMVTLMKNEDQLQKWLAVYKHMQTKYHIGMVLGCVGYFLFAYGIQQKA